MMDETEAPVPKRGRPPGTGPVASLRRELLTDGKLQDLVQKAYELAIAGDVAAIRLLLDRAWPALRAQSAPVSVQVPANASLTDQARAILQAATSGSMPPDIASDLISSLAKVASVEQADELRRRLDELEFGGLA